MSGGLLLARVLGREGVIDEYWLGVSASGSVIRLSERGNRRETCRPDSKLTISRSYQTIANTDEHVLRAQASDWYYLSMLRLWREQRPP